jgi:hypothetical protein
MFATVWLGIGALAWLLLAAITIALPDSERRQ